MFRGQKTKKTLKSYLLKTAFKEENPQCNHHFDSFGTGFLGVPNLGWGGWLQALRSLLFDGIVLVLKFLVHFRVS